MTSPTARRMRLMLAMVGVLSAGAASADAATREQLKERFKQRYATLTKLKDAGKVGEVHDGYCDTVKNQYRNERVDAGDDASPTIAQFLGAENNDRRELYKIIAEETGADPATVAKRNAQRNFENAAADHYLKPDDRDWVKKKDL